MVTDGPFPILHGERDVDDSKMCKCLRKIAERFSRVGVDFLSEQPHIVAKGKKMPERLPGGRVLPFTDQILDLPKAAEAERSFGSF